MLPRGSRGDRLRRSCRDIARSSPFEWSSSLGTSSFSDNNILGRDDREREREREKRVENNLDAIEENADFRMTFFYCHWRKGAPEDINFISGSQVGTCFRGSTRSLITRCSYRAGERALERRCSIASASLLSIVVHDVHNTYVQGKHRPSRYIEKRPRIDNDVWRFGRRVSVAGGRSASTETAIMSALSIPWIKCFRDVHAARSSPHRRSCDIVNAADRCNLIVNVVCSGNQGSLC
jgi:hypothetical protein